MRACAAQPLTSPAGSVTMARADEPAGVLGAAAERRFLTASDGVNLHYLSWRSGRSPPWAVRIFLHGIASHAGWFGETAAHLNEHGGAVYGPDRRGSGRSGYAASWATWAPRWLACRFR
jgi:alpha-beta hydrolase superfamily lysophospholipase